MIRQHTRWAMDASIYPCQVPVSAAIIKANPTRATAMSVKSRILYSIYIKCAKRCAYPVNSRQGIMGSSICQKAFSTAARYICPRGTGRAWIKSACRREKQSPRYIKGAKKAKPVITASMIYLSSP